MPRATVANCAHGPFGFSLPDAALRRLCRGLLLAISIVIANAAAAQTDPPSWLGQLMPKADRIGPFSGKPRSAPVYAEGVLAGYVFSTQEVIGSVGYSGKPIDVVVGLDLEGVVTGAYLRSHREPILVIGVPEADLESYVAGFAGLDTRQAITVETTAASAGLPEAISGATISSAVIRDAILRSSRAVAYARGLLTAAGEGPRLDRERFEPASWQDLVADGSLASLTLSRGDVDAAFGGATPGTEPEDLFIELTAGLATPPRVGENLLGKQAFSRLTAEMAPEDLVVVVTANGAYSFKGTSYRRTGVFDRIQIVQGPRTIRLSEEGYRLQEKLTAEGAPEFREIGSFVIPGDAGLDPLAPWRLELLVERQTSGGAVLRTLFPLAYELPARYRLGDPAAVSGEDLLQEARRAEGESLWVAMWWQRKYEVATLAAALLALSALLVFQDALVRDRRVYRAVRLSFLGFTLVWIGWIAGGQLSVVNVLTFVSALLTEFRWDFFLLDPVIFILWAYVAVALLFWGRGVFCGWLCPFGALQELLNEGARRFKVPQLDLPFAVHERLWPLKYVIFLGLFAVSLHSTNLAVIGAEVEPFKTAISLKFVRHWPFVLYAVALLTAGLFIERFFCRYLCPLGAALAIPARLRMFNWLKRKHQCGRECNICAVRCTVQAIHPTGQINPNECIHCLNCQNLYYDDKTCPPLIARRKRREERKAMAARGDARRGAREAAGDA